MGDSTATPTELGNAADIQMEGTGQTVLEVPEAARESMFGEKVEPTETPSDVIPAPSQPSDEESSVDPAQDPDDGHKGDSDLTIVPKPTIAPEIEKLTEHKTNLEKALAAERARVKSLQYQIAQTPQIPQAQPVQTEKEFKVLSEPELEELMEDDPMKAVKYTAKLQGHYRQEDARRQQDAQRESIVSESMGRISDIVPGIYDQGSDVGLKLTEYAVDKGFDVSTLAALSNPGTQIIVPGENSPRLVGDGAVALVGMINSGFRGGDDSALRAQIEKEVTERVTKEFTRKLKASPGAPNLGDLPASSKESSISSTWKPMSETELRVLTPDQRERYRRGEAV